MSIAINKKKFFEYIKENNNSEKQYVPIVGNELYKKLISRKTKKVIGLNKLYNRKGLNYCKLNEDSSAEDRINAINELNDICKKISTFQNNFAKKTLTNIDKSRKLFDENPLTLKDIVKAIKDIKSEENDELYSYISEKEFNLMLNRFDIYVRGLISKLEISVQITKSGSTT